MQIWIEDRIQRATTEAVRNNAVYQAIANKLSQGGHSGPQFRLLACAKAVVHILLAKILLLLLHSSSLLEPYNRQETETETSISS